MGKWGGIMTALLIATLPIALLSLAGILINDEMTGE
jgi:hypothetical protein